MPLTRIIQGVNQFHENYFAAHQELFEQLSQSQSPDVLFITCSDSRIDPFLITQSPPGRLFVIRNVGNIVSTYGSSSITEAAAIEYAVQALGVKEIIVCGHSHCGAMRGLLQVGSLVETMPMVYTWLRTHAEATRRLLIDNYPNETPERLLKIAIEQNILSQIENLETHPVVRSRLHAGTLNLHAWMYEIETGSVYAFDAAHHKFSLLEQRSFPVPDPLILR
ncbi:MAG: carbonic anhydrase [Drouetiella hepatica Uher 2000/2452]|jgi:carbonic anhydrase|uniref:Carbonic anhydrase n=1 Tax=Drouetiella hepatica Uher 2000/2452 TaxID=904376 RepID=A0A951UKQ1_9CYAN|nr:carbonic anhydrase [Drouetiella hepatica Uher 2000/2452]